MVITNVARSGAMLLAIASHQPRLHGTARKAHRYFPGPGRYECLRIHSNWQLSTFASRPMDSLSAKCSQVEFAIRVKPRWDFVASFMRSVLASVLSLCSFHKQTSWSSFRSGTAGTKVQPGSSTTQRAQIKKILLAPEITRGTHHQVS